MISEFDENLMIENHLGRYSLKQVRELASQTLISDKIEKWTDELICCFPESTDQIKTYMSLLRYSQDRYVLETLYYADANLYFCENKDHDGLGMKYKYNQNCIQISRSFLKEILSQNSLLSACLFLDKIIHELTHAAQDMRGLAPLRALKMNLSNAVMAELMVEVDASVVGLHIQYELAGKNLNKAPEWVQQNSDLAFYTRLIQQYSAYQGQNLTGSQQQHLADAALMCIFLDFKQDIKQNDVWQETYFRQMVHHLLCRPVHSLTTKDKENKAERYLMKSYQKRYPLLSRVQQRVLSVLPIQPIEMAVVIGNSFPLKEPVSYGAVHEAKIKLLINRNKISAYNIYKLIKRQNQR